MSIALQRFLQSRPLWAVGCLVLLVSAASFRSSPRPSVHYKDGAPPGMTGGFGGENCHSCHFDQVLDNPDGLLEVTGVPVSYQPDSIYRIKIHVARPGLGKAGFALAARFDENTPAGQLATLDSTARIAGDAEATPYATHTKAGALIEGDTATWNLNWTAPSESDRSAVFNIAANAANGDDSEFGDWIYTVEVLSQPE